MNTVSRDTKDSERYQTREWERQLEGIVWYREGLSALTRLHHRDDLEMQFVLVHADVAELARRFTPLEYPGIQEIDAVFQDAETRILFRCLDPAEGVSSPRAASQVQPLDYYCPGFRKNSRSPRFVDPRATWATSRNPDWTPEPADTRAWDPRDYLWLAVYAAHFQTGFMPEITPCAGWPATATRNARETRLILELVLSGQFSGKALEILDACGWIGTYLPELVPMQDTHHTKDGHPEGDVWKHSLATLEYRKTCDLVLSFALLLHDSGKPHVTSTRQKMFDGHAEKGAQIARSLLSRLGFSAVIVSRVSWLVENHMMPQAIDELPLSRCETLFRNPEMPLLLELFRCDLVSTYRGPDAYYRACQKFRSWLKNTNNPWLKHDRKRLIQRYVEA